MRAAAGEGTATVAVGTGTTTDSTTATYGSDLSTVGVTVGTLAYLRIKLTVGASHIAAAENNVTMQIPTNLFPNNGFDTAPEASAKIPPRLIAMPMACPIGNPAPVLTPVV